MTKEEALKVLLIMAGADNGCSVCAGSLFGAFAKVFPEFEDLADEIEDQEFGIKESYK